MDSRKSTLIRWGWGSLSLVLAWSGIFELTVLLSNNRTAAAPQAELQVCLSGCPYTSIQSAVDAADTGAVIKIATGWYTGVSARSGITQLVYLSKTVTLQGGYTTTNWMIPYPLTQPTILDAQYQGRVFYLTGNITPTLAGLHITGGNAAGLGGNSSLAPSDVGGGLYIASTRAILSQNKIYRNWAGHGGGVFVYNSRATLVQNTVISNTAQAFGGGVALDTSAAVLTGNHIITNTAWSSGGGVYLRSSPARLDDNVIESNYGNSGGGVHLYISHATLADNLIKGNTAAYYGGGVYMQYSSATLATNVIRSNRVTHNVYSAGGGVYASGNPLTSTANTVTFNQAHKGGGLYLTDNSGSFLNTNVITANQAHEGGGLYLYGGPATLQGNVIASNTALTNGGGIFIIQAFAPKLINTMIVDNHAGQYGSGVYVWGTASWGILQFVHTTFAQNTGGDGSGLHLAMLGEATYSQVALTNTILVSQTVGVTVAQGCRATLTATLWGGAEWGNLYDYDGPGDVIIGAPSLEEEPGFIHPARGNYHIGYASGARNSGINAGITTDIDGEARPAENDYDLGADEFYATPLMATREISGPGLYDFGDIGARLYFTHAGTLKAVTVTLVYTYPTRQTPHHALPRNYSITAEGSGFTGTLTLAYTNEDLAQEAIADESSLQLYRFDPGSRTWQPYASTVNAAANLVTATSVNEFSVWAIGTQEHAPHLVALYHLSTVAIAPWVFLCLTGLAIWLHCRLNYAHPSSAE